MKLHEPRVADLNNNNNNNNNDVTIPSIQIGEPPNQ